MPKHGKRFRAAKDKIAARLHTLEEAVQTVRQAAFANFDETVEVALRLGVDPKHADQMVRGTVVLPHGTGQSKRVLVIATGEKAKEAETAGADRVLGSEGLMLLVVLLQQAARFMSTFFVTRQRSVLRMQGLGESRRTR